MLKHRVRAALQKKRAERKVIPKALQLQEQTSRHEAADHPILALQHQVGNATVGRLIACGDCTPKSGLSRISRRPKVSVQQPSDSEIEVRDVPKVVQSGKAEAVDMGNGALVRPGQSGYARALLAATGDRAEKMAHNYTDDLLTTLLPDLSGYDVFEKVRAHEEELFTEEAEPAHVPIVGWSLGGSPSARKVWTNAAGWCQDRIGEATKDKAEEKERFDQYNAWVPRANGFFTSLERLQAQSWMIGHGNDTETLGAAILQGLNEAESVAHMAQTANDAGKAAALPPLASDGSLLQASTEASLSAREMNTAYLGFQELMIGKEADVINSEGDKDRDRLNEIKEVKEFLKNVGKTVDTTFSVIEGAPATVANATELMEKTGASINAARNRSQIMKGERPTHNPTYVTTDEHGNMVVRNLQTHTERNLVTGERGDLSESSTGLPHDVSSAMEALSGFIYAKEVLEINRRLEEIKFRVTATKQAASFVHVKEVTQRFQDTLNRFADACKKLQSRMAARRDQYLAYGVALDNFIRQDAKAQRSSSGAKGADYFATIMTLTGAIRETLTIGKGAQSSFMSPNEIAAWGRGINERRSRDDCPMRLPESAGRGFWARVQPFECTEKEWAQISSMWNQVRKFNEYVDQINGDLGPVDARAKLMLGASHRVPSGEIHGLSQGGGSGEY